MRTSRNRTPRGILWGPLVGFRYQTRSELNPAVQVWPNGINRPSPQSGTTRVLFKQWIFKHVSNMFQPVASPANVDILTQPRVRGSPSPPCPLPRRPLSPVRTRGGSPGSSSQSAPLAPSPAGPPPEVDHSHMSATHRETKRAPIVLGAPQYYR